MEEYLDIGKIVNTHGLKGDVKVVPLTDDPMRYNKLKWVYIEIDNQLVKYYIVGIKYFKAFVILKFEGIDDKDTAQRLKEKFLKIDRANAVRLPQGSYFICDLIGCIVFNEHGQKLGILTDILETGSNDVYVIKNDLGKEMLIPALKSLVKNIDIENQKIEVENIEGFINDEI